MTIHTLPDEILKIDWMQCSDSEGQKLLDAFQKTCQNTEDGDIIEVGENQVSFLSEYYGEYLVMKLKHSIIIQAQTLDAEEV